MPFNPLRLNCLAWYEFVFISSSLLRFFGTLFQGFHLICRGKHRSSLAASYFRWKPFCLYSSWLAHSSLEQFNNGVVAVFYGDNQGTFIGSADLVRVCATI